MGVSDELHKRRGAAVARGVGSVVSSYVDHGSGALVVGPVWLAWRLLSVACEAFDQAGDKVLEFESAVLVQVE